MGGISGLLAMYVFVSFFKSIGALLVFLDCKFRREEGKATVQHCLGHTVQWYDKKHTKMTSHTYEYIVSVTTLNGTYVEQYNDVMTKAGKSNIQIGQVLDVYFDKAELRNPEKRVVLQSSVKGALKFWPISFLVSLLAFVSFGFLAVGLLS